MRAALGDAAIEDFWLRFFCVTTNLSSGQLEVHERGPASRYVRAAMSILGLLPPVIDGESLLVDGGYLNNVRTQSADTPPRTVRGQSVDTHRDI